MGDYLRPRSVSQALDALRDGRPTILAGGTDYYPARVGHAPADDILDLSGLDALRGIELRDDQWRIGALATWSELLRADLPPAFDGLKRAAREVGGMQIQNAGTVCGNLCNASPAADGAPPLLTLDAAVELSSSAGIERVALDRFITGNRRTVRRPDQLVTAVLVPAPPGGARGHFLKLGTRKYLVISIVMVAAALEAGADGRVRGSRSAPAPPWPGACRPSKRRSSADRPMTAWAPRPKRRTWHRSHPSTMSARRPPIARTRHSPSSGGASTNWGRWHERRGRLVPGAGGGRAPDGQRPRRGRGRATDDPPRRCPAR